MTEVEIENFVKAYQPVDFVAVSLDWNGRTGAEFYDAHYDLRMRVCAFIETRLDSVNIELIRDLYIELAQVSAYTHSVYSHLHKFGEEMLRRDWQGCLMDFMRGGSFSFDAYMSAQRIALDPVPSRKILEYIQNELLLPGNEPDKKIMQLYLGLFERLSEAG